MAKLLKTRKAIFLDNAEEQYKELGYPHRNMQSWMCECCGMTFFVDESIKARYCYNCGAIQNYGEDGE